MTLLSLAPSWLPWNQGMVVELWITSQTRKDNQQRRTKLFTLVSIRPGSDLEARENQQGWREVRVS